MDFPDLHSDLHFGETEHPITTDVPDPSFNHPGGYHADYDGVADCWYSSDGYIYDSSGNQIGTH
ncbi:hypothetical protein AB5J62_20095 [Amycolatopsis sp. cg5]|uniref:hypothetical protein n=1 Tax=Amycolatopsis sp. cg5 TaxID=3238802 RepID=UPI0035257E1D